MIRRWRTAQFGFGRRDQRWRVRPLNGQLDYVASLTGGILPAGIVFTRAATSGIGQTGCTYIDANGDFQVAGADVPRFNCPFGGGAIRGLLIEEQRTNLCRRTAWTGNTNISTPPTGWTFPFGTGTSKSEESLYGSNDGASAIRQNCSGERAYLSQTFSCTGGVTYCMSVYVEEIASGSVMYNNFLFPSPSGMATVSSSTYYRDGVAVTATGNLQPGRITCVFVCGTGGNIGFRVGAGCQSSATVNVLMSRPQFEASDWPSSYIPTDGSAITRPADFAYVMKASMPLTDAAGTVVVGYYRGEGSGKTLAAAGVMADGADKFNISVHGGGSNDHDATDGITTLETTDGQPGANVSAFAWDSTMIANASFCVNGGTVASDLLTLPTGFTKVRLGGLRSTQVLGQEITMFAAYTGRLSDARLQELTA